MFGLAPAAITLAQTLRSHGYKTASFVAIDYLTSAFSMDRGFDEHKSILLGPVSTRSRAYQSELLKYARWPHLKPFFLFAHYFDAHSPYDPPPPFSGMYYEGAPRSRMQDGLRVLFNAKTNRLWETPIYSWLRGITDIDFPIQQYAAGITHLDHTVGTLLDALRSSGLMDRSIVVLVADHGEHLTEHKAFFYHRYPYEEVLHVPLMIRLPGGVGGGRRVRQDVSLVDVFPTVLELAGLPLENEIDGVSLAGAIRSESPPPERLLFAEFGTSPKRWIKVVWDERYRLLSFNMLGRSWTELYDRQEDPAETRDLSSVLPRERERLSAALDARFPPEQRIRARELQDVQTIDPDVDARLRALGYVD